MKTFLILLALLPVWTVSAQERQAEQPEEHRQARPLVVASIRPLALMAADLGGDWLAVETMLSPNQEPHHVALSIAQRRQLARADLVLWVSPELETFLVKLLEPLAERSLNFEQTLDVAAVERHPHDFHYWLHPELAARFYRGLAAKLSAMFPDRAPQVDRALDRQLRELQVLSAELAATLAGGGRLIVDHQAYGYFADHFNVEIAGALVDESGVAAGPRSLAALGGEADIRCIAVETLPPARRAQKMARTLGVKVVAIDPLAWKVPASAGYFGVLRSVAAGFAECLVANGGRE